MADLKYVFNLRNAEKLLFAVAVVTGIIFIKRFTSENIAPLMTMSS